MTGRKHMKKLVYLDNTSGVERDCQAPSQKYGKITPAARRLTRVERRQDEH
jgi:hypothetical protein